MRDARASSESREELLSNFTLYLASPCSAEEALSLNIGWSLSVIEPRTGRGQQRWAMRHIRSGTEQIRTGAPGTPECAS